jgi:hypothetical protein
MDILDALRERVWFFGLGVRSQKVSGTKRKRRHKQKPPTMATIL